MAFLPEFFAKEELNKLRDQLASLGNHNLELESRLANEVLNGNALLTEKQELELQIEKLTNEFIDADDRSKKLRAEQVVDAEMRESHVKKLESQLEALSSKNSELSSEISVSEEKIADQARKLTEAVESILQLQKKLLEKNDDYEARELKLAEKSEKLQQEKNKFQTQSQNLLLREQQWKNHIEPKLAAYELHLTLDEKRKLIEKATLDQDQREVKLLELAKSLEDRGIKDEFLSQRENEIDEWNTLLTNKQKEIAASLDFCNNQKSLQAAEEMRLSEWEKRLAKFQSQVDELEDGKLVLKEKVKKFEKKSELQEEQHAQRLEEIRLARSEIRQKSKLLSEREDWIKNQEIEVKKIEEKYVKVKDSNLQLKRQLTECLEARQELEIEFENKLKESARSNSQANRELQISGYDPERDSGDIEQLPLNLRGQTPMTAHDYKVGVSGIEDEEERRDVLRSLIGLPYSKLQKVGDVSYMRQWGEAKTAKRVRCIAYHLSWNIGFQGAKEGNELARDHWLNDLKWLTKNYKGKIPNSDWPKVPKS